MALGGTYSGCWACRSSVGLQRSLPAIDIARMLETHADLGRRYCRVIAGICAAQQRQQRSEARDLPAGRASRGRHEVPINVL